MPLVGVWDSPDEIDFDSLPERFALKATHGSAWNILVTDKGALDVRGAGAGWRPGWPCGRR